MEMEAPSQDSIQKVETGGEGYSDCMDYICLPDETGHTTMHDDWTLLSPKDEEVQFALTACWIAVGAILGSFLRMAIAQLFGQACANPGSVGWISAAAPLCVTADGNTQQQGGIVFADLPSNLLGSFLMGLVQNHMVLGLAVPMSIAWLAPFHPLQRASALQTAFKTGFCGSLTTFSSWNSEMIVMLFGSDQTLHTQVWSALFGYIIGMETALGSYVCGCSVARRLHHWVNPILTEEARAVRKRALEGVHVNHDLPDLERRFLPDLPMNTATRDLYGAERIHDLSEWRASTVQARRVGNPDLAALVKIENAVLVLQTPIDSVSISTARRNNWELDRLLDYAASKSNDFGALPKVSSSVSLGNKVVWQDHEMWWTRLSVAATVLVILLILLVLGLIFVDDVTEASVTYRTMIFAMLLAPSGALLRWKWSALNTNCRYLPAEWKWLPAGTFLANVCGSLVSILMVGLEWRLEQNSSSQLFSFWRYGTIRAIKIGFSGCLTTVSTFVSEVQSFMLTKTDHAYPYIFVTLLTSCVLSCVVFALVVFV